MLHVPNVQSKESMVSVQPNAASTSIEFAVMSIMYHVTLCLGLLGEVV